eukprot:g46711.t1
MFMFELVYWVRDGFSSRADSFQGLWPLPNWAKLNLAGRKMDKAVEAFRKGSPGTLTDFVKGYNGRELNLEGKSLGSGGAVAVAEALKSLSSLFVLRLGSNKLRDEGALAIAAALWENNTLQELHLQDNQISVEGVTAIAQAAEVCPALRVLNLSYNSPGPLGCRALFTALLHRPLRPTSLMEGYLQKKGQRIKTWKKRYFIITQEELFYYEDKIAASREDKEKGCVSLQDALYRHGGKQYMFQLNWIKNARTLECKAESEPELRKWRKVLELENKERKGFPGLFCGLQHLELAMRDECAFGDCIGYEEDKCLSTILEALSTSSTLTYLDIRGHHLTQNAKSSIAKAIESNPCLERLRGIALIKELDSLSEESTTQKRDSMNVEALKQLRLAAKEGKEVQPQLSPSKRLSWRGWVNRGGSLSQSSMEGKAAEPASTLPESPRSPEEDKKKREEQVRAARTKAEELRKTDRGVQAVTKKVRAKRVKDRPEVTMHAFLAGCAQDTRACAKIQTWLGLLQVTVWDQSEKPEDSLSAQVIAEHLSQCCCLVIYVTPDFFIDPWCQVAYQLAEEWQMPVVPIRVALFSREEMLLQEPSLKEVKDLEAEPEDNYKQWIADKVVAEVRKHCQALQSSKKRLSRSLDISLSLPTELLLQSPSPSSRSLPSQPDIPESPASRQRSVSTSISTSKSGNRPSKTSKLFPRNVSNLFNRGEADEKQLTYFAFLSHTQRDDKAVNIAVEVYSELKERGKDCWLDVKMEQRDMGAMERGIKDSACFIAIISDNKENSYFSREMCRKELMWADENRKPIVPLVNRNDKDRISDFIKSGLEYGINLKDINFCTYDRSSPALTNASIEDILKGAQAPFRSIVARSATRRSVIEGRRKSSTASP